MKPRITLISGHYGSGKTEFALSLVYQRSVASEAERLVLADLDYVNPYFRSREKAEELEAQGIEVISSSLGHQLTLDLPAVPGTLWQPIMDPDTELIVDLGGDPSGARVIATFASELKAQGYESLLVLNQNRPETDTIEKVLRMMQEIEDVTGLAFSGLVCNTHMLNNTTYEDIERGYRLAEEVSEASGVPIAYLAAVPDLLSELPAEWVGERIPIGMHMRDEWM